MFGASFYEFIILFFGLLGGAGSSVGIPVGMPPGPEDPLMADVAPDSCLAYTTWWATATPDPAGNVTERWLAQPELAAAVSKLETAYRTGLLKTLEPENHERLENAFDLSRHLLTHSCAVYLTRYVPDVEFLPSEVEGAVVAHLGDQPDVVQGWIEAIIGSAATELKWAIEETVVGERPMRACVVGTDPSVRLTWGRIGEAHFALAIGEGEMERLLARLDGSAPDWLKELRERSPIERPSFVSRIDGPRAIEMIRTFAVDLARQFGEEGDQVDAVFQKLGLTQLQSIGMIGGLTSDGFESRMYVDLDGEPKGIFGLLANEPLTEEQIGLIPGDSMGAVAVALSPRKCLDLMKDLTGPAADNPLDHSIRKVNQAAEIDFEADVIDQLDNFVFGYGSISFTNPSGGWIVGVGAGNSMSLVGPVEAISRWTMEPEESADEFSQPYEYSTSETAGTTWYTGKVASGGYAFPEEFSWGLSSSEFLYSFDKSLMRKHLRREHGQADALVQDPRFRQVLTPSPGAAGPLVAGAIDWPAVIDIAVGAIAMMGEMVIPEDLGFQASDIPPVEILNKEMKRGIFAVYRTEKGFESVQWQTYPGASPLNSVLAMGIIAIPASTQLALEFAETNSMNNMRQLVLAMHHYHDVHGAMPAQFNQNEAGEPLLSWRVHLLPYLGYDELYREFRLDEPWDSEHNRALVEKMPPVFACERITAEPGMTPFLTLDGEGAVLRAPSDSSQTPTGMRLEEVSDGTSRTAGIVLVRPENAVVWTRPVDYKWAEQPSPESGLFSGWSGATHVATCDGAVYARKIELMAEWAERLFRANDGDAIEGWH